MQGTKSYKQNNLKSLKNRPRENWQEIKQNATVVASECWGCKWVYSPLLFSKFSLGHNVLFVSEKSKHCLNTDIYGYKYKSVVHFLKGSL